MAMMKRLCNLLGLTAVVLAGLAAENSSRAAPLLDPAASQQSGGEVTSSRRLADELARNAVHLLYGRALTVEGLEAAGLLLDEAVALDRDNAELWRLRLDVAALAERDDDRRRALAHLVRLDPADEVVRLKWLNLEIDKQQTVEVRVAEYRRLLAPERRAELGAAVASRLAFDLALLERRRGDSQAFARWLAEAVSLDSTNREAAALAAGFFRMNVNDPFAEAELLVALLLADPMDRTAQTTLAAHLLEHGAYTAAERLYLIAVRSHRAARADVADLMADLALTQWARGDAAGALVTIHERQREVDTQFRMRLLRDRPELTPLERARYSAPISPVLATVRAAIYVRTGHEQAGQFVRRAIETYETQIAALGEEDEADAGRIARLHLEAAWVMLWLGGDTERATEYVERAGRYRPLSDAAVARFNGWASLRRGEFETALELLRPHGRHDSAAGLGVATVLLELGQRRAAAQELLAIARSRPGSLIGVWAADVLLELLGQRVPLSREAAEMERLVSAVPAVIDRFAEQPTTAVSIRLLPSKTVFSAYEPLLVHLEIANHAPFPLAIGRDGPISSQLVIQPRAQLAGVPPIGPIPPHVVDIGRRLRLMPRERLIVPVDLRWTRLGLVMDRSPLPGAIIRAKATLNATTSPAGTVMAGLMGSEFETAPLRVDGARMSLSWLEEALEQTLHAGPFPDLSRVALLSHIAATPLTPQTQPLHRQVIRDALAALVEVFPRLDGVSQAWLLVTMPQSQNLEPIIAMARRTQNRHVHLAYIVFHATGTEDPMFDAAMRGGDATLRRLAELARKGVEMMPDEPDERTGTDPS
jgi:tetratricopeptide (TPR) repeat protein